eukprot:3087250-Rhodomonas_salina.1
MGPFGASHRSQCGGGCLESVLEAAWSQSEGTARSECGGGRLESTHHRGPCVESAHHSMQGAAWSLYTTGGRLEPVYHGGREWQLGATMQSTLMERKGGRTVLGHLSDAGERVFSDDATDMLGDLWILNNRDGRRNSAGAVCVEQVSKQHAVARGW